VTVDQLDSDLWLINDPDGTTELKTGKTREHRREDYITKSTAVAPGGDCPLFRKFLDTIFDGDCDLIDYVQKVLGYCLTGETREHALFFLYGTGANGKSVLLSTVSGLLDRYCKTAGFETFAASSSPGHPTDIAGLRGARLVICSEVEQGRRWAESKIKSLTGGDRIEARFMRQDFFEFVPQFKLMIAGNHKPSLRNVDEAIRRRMHLIPFAVTIPEKDRDKHLADKLRAEWPGILKWIIEGCTRWQEEGLEKPEAVARATDEYLAAEDVVLTWMDEKCELGKSFEATSEALFGSWRDWAERNNEFVGTQKAFSQKLVEHGLQSRHTMKGMAYIGIKLVT
jgi:putative DNA primase/helicase